MTQTQASPQDLDSLLSEVQAAQFIGFTPRALQSWRQRGGGPAFIKANSRIRYTKRDLVAWIDARRRASTSDSGSAAAQ